MADTNIPPRRNSIHSIHEMPNPLPRELFLYNGVSNRLRGWKTKKSDKIVDMRQSRKFSVRRWDGASMSSNAWDSLKRDPELWSRDGNCYIHLYGQGQSRRGPAFKVPFSRLLEASCYPFVDRFMAQGPMEANGQAQDDNGDLVRQSRIELFIPAPPRLDKQLSYNYHLATRNFIAYVFGRSMVGEHLGPTLVTLLHSMHEFRTEDVDNVRDLMSYLDEEGYLNFRNNPTHALAAIHLAEFFQLRDLYIDAFAHCCGMSSQLPISPGYQLVSPGTRKLTRCARVEMNLRLGQSANMVGTFLQYELSEAYLGLYAGARAHLERFRTLLHDHYAAKFGFYPPPSVDCRATIFEIDILREMREDFEALYQYLVDETLDTTTHNGPLLAEGRIRTWQSIQSFDKRHEFKTLVHPLPLLPEVSRENTKRTSWLGKPMKADRKWRENTHAALLEATNHRGDLMKNKLVRVYHRFEERLACCPTKEDKLENLGPTDSRKVRWILIYATYQALRQATDVPSEVRNPTSVPYHLCISTADLPPWDEDRSVKSLVRRQTQHVACSSPTSPTNRDSIRPLSSHEQIFEIKPDIDYFAITHRENSTEAKGASRLRRAESWRGSLTSNLSRSLMARRSSAKLTKQQPDKPTYPNCNTQYHEIVVQGYGNGTNDIKATLVDIPPPKTRAPPPPPTTTTAEEDPTSASSSRYSSSADLRRPSHDDDDDDDGSAAKTPDTSVCSSAPPPPPPTTARLRKKHRGKDHRRSWNGDASRDAVPRWIGSTCAGLRRRLQDEHAVGCGLMRRRSRGGGGGVDLSAGVREVAPAVIEMPAPQAPTSWDYVKAVMEVKATSWMASNDVHPEWEQYNDLGGLTVLHSGVPSPAAKLMKAPPAGYLG
ncbi:hypothetical protein F4804DRAFT_351847 [Jackrogersella minutella]|nr:hypothetical protein F4804DRAFT_351847 [Jackrogersella minutella]